MSASGWLALLTVPVAPGALGAWLGWRLRADHPSLKLWVGVWWVFALGFWTSAGRLQIGSEPPFIPDKALSSRSNASSRSA